MFYLRLFFYATLPASFPSLVFATPPETITSLITIKDKVNSLLEQGAESEDIVVVWDCHGVITAQGMPKKGVKMTLSPDVLDVLEYLNIEKIPQIIATAWHDPYEVQKDLERLQVASYFEAEKVKKKSLKNIALGKNRAMALQGYKIGRLIALRKYEYFPEPFFYKKAFGAEWCFPENNFKHIIFVDDNERNLRAFEEDFKETIYYNDKKDMKKLTLYHFFPAASKVKLKQKLTS